MFAEQDNTRRIFRKPNFDMNPLDIRHLFDVSGRVALVTGGSSGIGLMIAKVLYQISAQVSVFEL
jgi:hypothetical protein